uniref:Uncharacterized protein n=1 Tax=Anguilla anguilla TaxID=7936 RepID=A0A0E9W941_ANGAN
MVSIQFCTGIVFSQCIVYGHALVFMQCGLAGRRVG